MNIGRDFEKSLNGLPNRGVSEEHKRDFLVHPQFEMGSWRLLTFLFDCTIEKFGRKGFFFSFSFFLPLTQLPSLYLCPSQFLVQFYWSFFLTTGVQDFSKCRQLQHG